MKSLAIPSPVSTPNTNSRLSIVHTSDCREPRQRLEDRQPRISVRCRYGRRDRQGFHESGDEPLRPLSVRDPGSPDEGRMRTDTSSLNSVELLECRPDGLLQRAPRPRGTEEVA